MWTKDKTLVVIVTQDNPILLRHMFESFTGYDPLSACDFLIVDHESTDLNQDKLLAELQKKWGAQLSVVQYENNRVEVSFQKAYQENKEYRYYFFLHDDAGANREGWLKVYIDRLNSKHAESIIQNTHLENLPIGRVGTMHQPWRSYSSILGYPVQCLFLEHVIKILHPGAHVPEIFKFADPDRVLVSNECMEANDGLTDVNWFKELKERSPNTFGQLKEVLDKYLPYYDEGIPPRDKYPPGECWNKLTMTSEFLSSVDPLLHGFRTVGLEGDGYLEQIHGYDVPWGHNFVHHYGAPNMKQFLAKHFNTDPKEIAKQFKNKVFLVQADKLIKQYFERKV